MAHLTFDAFMGTEHFRDRVNSYISERHLSKMNRKIKVKNCREVEEETEKLNLREEESPTSGWYFTHT